MRSILVLVSFCLSSIGIAQKPQSSPAHPSKMSATVANEMQGYKLKLDVLHTFDTINASFDRLASRNAIFTGRYEAFQAVMDGTAKSINETASPFGLRFPEADAAIRKAGFSTRQYLLVYCIVMEAYLNLDAPVGSKFPPGLSQANVDLLRTNSDLTRPIVQHVVKQQSGVE